MKKAKALYYLINFYLKLPYFLLKKNKIDRTTKILRNVNLSKCNIGKYGYIANNVNMVNVNVGNYVSIAPSVQIGGMEHSFWWYSNSTVLSDKCISDRKTIIEDDVWIAAGAIVKQGVKIGRGSVIGAMSFVNKDIPENSIAFGVPAKVIKQRFDKDTLAKVKASNYWEFEPKDARKILNNL